MAYTPKKGTKIRKTNQKTEEKFTSRPSLAHPESLGYHPELTMLVLGSRNTSVLGPPAHHSTISGRDLSVFNIYSIATPYAPQDLQLASFVFLLCLSLRYLMRPRLRPETPLARVGGAASGGIELVQCPDVLSVNQKFRTFQDQI